MAKRKAKCGGWCECDKCKQQRYADYNAAIRLERRWWTAKMRVALIALSEMLERAGIDPNELLRELEQRMGRDGHNAE